MDIFEAIKTRYSVRVYLEKGVEQEKIDRLMESARLAPSASNRQEWRFVVVRDAETRKKLSEAANDQRFVTQAPVVIVCCAESDEHVMACGHKCFLIDVAIAIDHITLAAVALGLGTCWVGAFDQGKVKEILNVPKDIVVVELLTLGYPDDSWREKRRLSIEEIVKYEKWE